MSSVFDNPTSSGSGTVTPRTFSTRRIVQSVEEYENTANLVKKYGCPVSKVSDSWVNDTFYTAIYFDIPIAFKDRFLAEEKG